LLVDSLGFQRALTTLVSLGEYRPLYAKLISNCLIRKFFSWFKHSIAVSAAFIAVVVVEMQRVKISGLSGFVVSCGRRATLDAVCTDTLAQYTHDSPNIYDSTQCVLLTVSPKLRVIMCQPKTVTIYCAC
jgi:hypothetical protein